MPATSTRPSAVSVGIVGAGSSGITVAKRLIAAGISVQLFEKGTKPGGLWRYGNDSGRVLVVGIGNSACDIAVDLARAADQAPTRSCSPT